MPRDDRNRQFLFNLPASAPAAAPKRKFSATPVIAALIAGVLGGIGGAVAISLVGAGQGTVIVNDAQQVNWVTGVAAKSMKSVVTISVGSANAAGSGSGVIVTEDGYILTNTHVVTLDGAAAKAAISVKTSDGRVYRASLVGTDPTNDLAIIKINGSFTPIVYADSDQLNVGDSVVAIGAPLGLEETVTTGVISALNRTIQVASAAVPDGSLQLWNGQGAAPISLRVIQTDAAINPGNSGGALLNANGELIGINVAIASTGSSGSSQSGSIGVGFSIPSNIAKRIAGELMKTGTASHALLGALVSDAADSANAASFSAGAKVEDLTAGGAAEQGGVKVGDIVTSFNGKPITSASELTAAVRLEPANSKATLTVTRGAESLTINVTLGDAAKAK